MRFDIPASVGGATKKLAELSGLIRASEWERAAIVATFVETSEQGVGIRQAGKARSSLSAQEFAALGIVGLRSKDTVRRYVDAWNSLGIGRPTPGERFDVEDLPDWPPDTTHPRLDNGPRLAAIRAQAEADGVGVAAAVLVAETLGAMAAAIKADDKTADVARKALLDRTEEIVRKLPKPRQPKSREIDDYTVARYGQYVLEAFIAMEEGRYHPSGLAAVILAALRPTVDWDAELNQLTRGGHI